MIDNKIKKILKFIRYSLLAVVLFVFAIARIPFNKGDGGSHLSKDEGDLDALFFPNVFADTPTSTPTGGGDSPPSDDD